ncbi:Ubiquitin carboxyl-terminal hydrolase 14 [Zancudomyces culisetae]|uniref:Ubiquitin carboxyl-terminal hydrolase n=1 Tax=Zancudomyces culisetae TaxID=1213189 RepID=A0A1R1PXG7_ZANCU|nr:Ubiquitin carboxyl-terminal hydrolase 14 [Zancudomyces culisetae]|eukprot:OMH85666.1 Ubiquitin carboxyl-terminal hydrolase 14 [Zancudomyces culisetae]
MNQGIGVCLTCFNGGCVGSEREHGYLHAFNTGHFLSLKVHKVRKSVVEDQEKDERPKKISRIEIDECEEERNNEKKYEKYYKLNCAECGEIHNYETAVPENYDGSGGNNHASEHYASTGHESSVKLGTIEPTTGAADVYCYKCDENRVDDNLEGHLKTFGIEVKEQSKTEKGMMELQLEQNLKMDFGMTSDDGTMLKAVVKGEGTTGLRNMGNSCYLSAAVQCVFTSDAFKAEFYKTASDHFGKCRSASGTAKCLECQTHKLAEGIWCGRYENAGSEEQRSKYGIAPRMFKDVLCRDSVVFGNARQQDSFEFFQFMVDSIGRINKESCQIYEFMVEEKIQCQECLRVRYNKYSTSSLTVPILANKEGQQPASIFDCIKTLCEDELIDNYACSYCKTKRKVKKTMRFVTFPKVLAIQVRRFELVDWVPQKINDPMSVSLTDETSLDELRAPWEVEGKSNNEELMPDGDDEGEVEVEVAVNEGDLNMLIVQGFPEPWCKYALQLNEGNVEAALEYLISNIELVTSSDTPPAAPRIQKKTTEISSFDQSQVDQLCEMGFTTQQANRALKKSSGDMAAAVEYLFNNPDQIEDYPSSPAVEEASTQLPSTPDLSPALYRLKSFISHKGSSLHSGHYVSHVDVSPSSSASRWIMFNDDRVVEHPDPVEAASLAYVYFFNRL